MHQNMLTDWIPSDVKPVREGPYQAKVRHLPHSVWYSSFRRGQFHGCWGSPEEAEAASRKAPEFRGCWASVSEWRGLNGGDAHADEQTDDATGIFAG